MINPRMWRWDGHAGHFVGASDCNFHLNTQVGRYRVSTVGEWRSSNPDGTGDYEEFKSIGSHRLFETFVFHCDDAGEVLSWSEIEGLGANDHDSAKNNHMALCWKYARRG